MTELTQARERLQLWLQAEAAVATGQAYRVGSRQLTRAHLSEIRRQINYWQGEIDRITQGRGRGGRVMRIIPRDL